MLQPLLPLPTNRVFVVQLRDQPPGAPLSCWLSCPCCCMLVSPVRRSCSRSGRRSQGTVAREGEHEAHR
jgi:hypothetical protein